MLRISIQRQPSGTVFLLEGRLEAPWIPELEKAVAQQLSDAGGGTLTIDLCGVTGMDALGESALRELYQHGAVLRCADLMNEFFVERMTTGATNLRKAISRPCHSSEV